MRALASTLLLLASPALAAPQGVRAPTLVAEIAGPAAAPVAAPLAVEPPAAAPPSQAAPSPIVTSPAAPGAAEPSQPKPPAPVVPSQALVEKVGHGDRLFLAGDHRNALFAYQDAVYMEPRYAPARVRLGRAYLALRYPAQAVTQAEAALAIAPDDPEARKLLEEAKNPSARPVSAPSVPDGSPAAAGAAAPPSRAAPRVFRFTPDAEGAGAAAPTPAAATASASAAQAPAAAPGAPAERVITILRTVPAEEARPGPAALDGPGASLGGAALGEAEGSVRSPASAAQHYRAALVQLQDREWAKAVTELTRSIRADPSLAVAYAARGSALFGLARYREAADDYRAALSLDRGLATPLYGLAECYRVLGDAKHAAEMYERYADSGAADARADLRTIAAKRAQELR
jgi:tetratricopeptide (TPR) repeat protein